MLEALVIWHLFTAPVIGTIAAPILVPLGTQVYAEFDNRPGVQIFAERARADVDYDQPE